MVPPADRPGRLLPIALVAVLVVYGGLVLAIALQWRQKVRHEVLRREAETIQAVAQMQLATSDVRLAEFAPEFAIDDMFDAVMNSAKLKGVLAVQLFDAQGALRKAAPLAPDDAATSMWWPKSYTQAEGRFVREGSWSMVSPQLALQQGTGERIPLLDVVVPLRESVARHGALGVARYWIDGSGVKEELARADRLLIAQVGAALLVGLLLAWSFVRLAETNRRLRAQSADLARANEELDFAAKTGALGAISAHLIHGLKNPLAGLEGFVADNAENNTAQGEAWRTAMETTQRLRAMVNEVTTVLRDEASEASDYAVPASEVVEAARLRVQPLAGRAGIGLDAAAEGGEIPARAANLAGLVLANLLTNAIEAAPPLGRVRLEAKTAAGGVEFFVTDSGPGLPAEVREALFRPVRSTKRGGGGVGLAISYRLAKHAGGELALVRSDAQGSVFRLFVPATGARVNSA